MKPELKKSLIHQHTEPLMIVISGPSGVGKDAVVGRMAQRKLPFHFVVTATTRPRRKEEIHGVDYFFLSMEEFTRMIEQGEFLEYALVYDQYKGVPKSQVVEALSSGKDIVMRLDVQGAATIHKKYPEALLIFLVPGTEEELENRLRKRETENPEDLQNRLAEARDELKCLGEFDYVVENRDSKLDKAVDIIEAIICAEHRRVKHRKVKF
jgi:guanylate kinase